MISFFDFLSHSTSLCLYDIRHLSNRTFVFPNVKTLSLIRCHHRVISTLLTPFHFPNLRTIHYLSLHPGSTDLHQRFSRSCKWIFPEINYPFYEWMVQSGHGRYDPFIINQYITRSTMVNQRIEFDLRLPGDFIVEGYLYKRGLFEYIYEKHVSKDKPSSFLVSHSSPLFSQETFHSNYIKKRTRDTFINCLIEEEEKDLGINLLDATPYHNLDK